MSVPDVAVAGAVLAIARSATRWAVDGDIAVLGKGVELAGRRVAETEAVVAIGPVAAGLMRTTIVKVWVAPDGRWPEVQVTVGAVVVHAGLAERMLAGAGRRSVTVPAVEAEGPLLVTVRE